MDDKNVEDVVEETTDELEANTDDDALNTEEQETDDEASELEDGDDLSDDEQARRERATNQINRLKEQNKKLKEQLEKGGVSSKESGQKGGEAQEIASSDLLYRTYLGQQGYTQRDVQDKAIDRAQRLGMSVDALLADPDEKAVLDAAVRRITAQNASARPTGKGGASKKDAHWYVNNNQLPDDPDLKVEVWKILAEKERK